MKVFLFTWTNSGPIMVQAVSSLSLWTPRFNPLSVNVGSVLDKVAQEQASYAEY